MPDGSRISCEGCTHHQAGVCGLFGFPVSASTLCRAFRPAPAMTFDEAHRRWPLLDDLAPGAVYAVDHGAVAGGLRPAQALLAAGQAPIADSYWVTPGRLLAGEYPGAPGPDQARPKLRRFLAAGITFFLDLTEEGELAPYAPLATEEADRMGVPVQHRRLSIRDLGTPSRARLVSILDTVDEALATGHHVYVHCWGGIGRTGTVVGAYLVRHGMNGKAALAEIVRLRQGIPDAWKPSPETEAQRQMVARWKEHLQISHS